MTFTLDIKTAEDKALEAAQARANAIKAECRARILSEIPETVQMNIAQAVTTYTATLLRGGTKEEAEAASGLEDADFPVAAAGRQWITAMQAECRRAIEAGAAPAWPELPKGVGDLVARL